MATSVRSCSCCWFVFVMFYIGNKNYKTKKLSILSSFAFGFIVAGIVFSENRMISYSFLAIGIILSAVDAYIKSKNKG